MTSQTSASKSLIRFSINLALLIIFATASVARHPLTQAEAQELPQTRPIERQLSGGQTHLYRIKLAVKEFLQVRVEQKGIDISINLSDVQRNVLAVMDSPNEKEGFETLSWVSETAGEYVIEISPLEKDAATGRYNIQRQNKREATAQDRRRVSVERVFMEAISARDAEEDEERAKTMPKLREALRGWEELQDKYMVEMTTRLLQQPRPDVRKLAIGETIERGLPEGEIHLYFLKISKGQVLSIEVKEMGAEITLKFYNHTSEESHLFAARNWSGGFGRESITFIADKDWVGMLAVRADNRVVKEGIGRYKLESHLNAAASPKDLRRVLAESLLDESEQHGGNIELQQEAIVKLEQSLSIWRELGENYWAGYTSNELGVLYLRMSNYLPAMKSFSAASILVGLDKPTDKWMMANISNNMSQVAFELGDIQFALDMLFEALPTFENLHDTSSQAVANLNLGRIYASFEAYERSLGFLEKALSQAKSLDDNKTVYSALVSMGGVYLGLNNPRQAERVLQQALQLAQTANDKYALSITMHNLAQLYIMLGDRNQARSYFQQALLHEKMSGNGLTEANTLAQLVQFWETANPRLAVFFAKQAVNRYQELRGSIQLLNTGTQKEFLRSVEDGYKHLVDLLISQGRLAEAQQALNSYKDQQVFDLNPQTIKKPSLLALTPRETLIAREYQKASERINASGSQLFEEETNYQKYMRQEELNAARNVARDEQAHEKIKAQLDKLQSEMKTASDNFGAVFKLAETEFGQPVSLKDKVGEVPDLREMQMALRELNQQTGSKTVALYTFIGLKDYRILLVTPDKIIQKSTPIVPADLSRKVIEFAYLLSDSDAHDPRPLGREIYRVMFAPIEEEIKKEKAETLLWSLDGELRYIPVAALHDGKQYMVERYRNVVFTRASRERLTSAVSKKWTGVGVGASNAQTVELFDEKISFVALPGVTTELERIFGPRETRQGILTGEALLDARFTFEALQAQLAGQPSVVHIASHFQFAAGDEYRSFLLLGNGQIVTLQQLKDYPDLFRGVELLTLSACNTGAQLPGANGREIDGFAELAQRQGAGAVMASLWAVADFSTAELMANFYQRRERQGLSKAEALRQAQVAMLSGELHGKTIKAKEKRADIIGAEPRKINAPRFVKDGTKPYAHPYYWAPFVLFGNGK
jgi:Uncharacterized protein conserved in bacteria